MLRMKMTWLFPLMFVLTASLTAVACGDDDDDDGGSGKGGSAGNAGSNSGGTGGAGGAGGTGGTGGTGGAGGSAGTGGSAGAGGAAGGGATFASLQSELIGCQSCHGANVDPPEGGFVLTYDNLINGVVNASCDPYEKYVDVDNPENSFLYAKLASPDDAPLGGACGTKMPPNSDPNGSPAAAAKVLEWIQAGAPEN
jgi:hypothetical protein